MDKALPTISEIGAEVQKQLDSQPTGQDASSPTIESTCKTATVMEKTPSSMEEELLDTGRVEISTGQPLRQNDSCDGDGDDDFWGEDGSNGTLNKAADLDREWQKRHDQFHTIGYRDGLSAGQEASAQEGFNDGFKRSVLVGYKWGLVRGVTSALACLPDGLKEKLVGVPETREKLQNLYGSAHSVSTQDALNMFHAEIMASGPEKESEISCSNHLGRYVKEFESLDLDSSAIKLHSTIEQQTCK